MPDVGYAKAIDENVPRPIVSEAKYMLAVIVIDGCLMKPDRNKLPNQLSI